MLVVEHRHYEIGWLQQQRRRVRGGVAGGNSDHDCSHTMRPHRIRDRFGGGEELTEVMWRHAFEIHDHASVPDRVDKRRDRTGGDRGHFGIVADAANDFGMKPVSKIGCDERRPARRVPPRRLSPRRRVR